MKKLFTLIITLIALLPVVSFHGNGKAAAEEQAYSGQELIEYSGKVYHIFFHSLILYPEQAFNSDMSAGYNDWMTTRDEFKRILDKLYLNDFTLVDINYARNAALSGKPLIFPKGKKPLIISVDDVNYYEYMKGDGFAEKLTVDSRGNLAAWVRSPEGGYFLDYEGDVIPIVDSFVRLHPDFSYKGAKGIVAVTGYQGVFGYRINTLSGAERSEAIAEASKTAQALKHSGWRIACHSYSHSNSYKDGSISIEKLKKDIAKWDETVAPITGKTDIFISPFGILFPSTDARFKYLAGRFATYCPVSSKMNSYKTGGCYISERLNFDGFTMLKYPKRITSCFFDLTGIIDGKRPAKA